MPLDHTLRGLLRSRHLSVVVAGFVLTMGWWLLGSPLEYAFWFLVGFCCLYAAIPRGHLGYAFLACSFLSMIAIRAISDAKRAATELPLTVTDLRMTFLHPTDILGVIKAPYWMSYLIGGLLILAAAVLFRLLRDAVRTRSPPRCRSLLAGSISAVLLTAAFLLFVQNFFDAVHRRALEIDVWEPAAVADLSQKTGAVGFLLYSYRLERSQSGDFFNTGLHAAPPTRQDVEEAARAYVRPARPRTLPNIIVVLAESTFDPNAAFRLATPVHNQLFDRNRYTHALGNLHVNPTGGGTWITEFELVTGIDSRLFGYSGYYTHSSLSPFVKETFVKYLARKGYRTEAFYPVSGKFYGARAAFRNYGFDTFLDVADLNLAQHWELRDEDLVDAAVSRAAVHGDAPTLTYICLLQNHAPHPCLHFEDERDFVTTFQKPADFEKNCKLNEYVRNAEATGRAFATLIAFAERTERATGRPFVILVFGDHQPHTFTGARGAANDYTAYRTAASPKETFFHLVSSIRENPVSCCGRTAPHITLMPSLVSAYTASSYDDLYVGVNFVQYQKCGSDFAPGMRPIGFYASLRKPNAHVSDACEIYQNLLTAYRKAGIF